MTRTTLLVAALVATSTSVNTASVMRHSGPGTKQLIAHRGASAYAPEHTLAAYQLAIDQGADFVEQDLAVTRDGALICLHDDGLERTTNVEEMFPDRATLDPATGGRTWLAMDFTLAEIKRLDAGAWFGPAFAGQRVPTWQEAIDAVRGRAGLYPELKSPGRYRGRQINMARLFAESLRQNGLDRPILPGGTRVIVQSFDPDTVRELARELRDVPRVLLLGGPTAAEWLSPKRLELLAEFATGIGPAKELIDSRAGLVRSTQRAGLTVTPYTFRSGDTGRFPDVRSEMKYFLVDLGVDAVFTDNPDLFPRE